MSAEAAMLDLEVILTPPAGRGPFSVHRTGTRTSAAAGADQGRFVRWVLGFSWFGTLLVVGLEWSSPHFRDALLACLGW